MSGRVYELIGVEQLYGDLLALNIEKLSINQGSIVGLVGPNGSGKSTLLRLLAFIDKPSRGEIFFRPGQGWLTNHSVRLRVTLLNQEPYLLKRSVKENVLYGLKVRKDRTDWEQRLRDALAWVGLSVDEFANRQWYELSGGEAQRVALASRLILKPQVLLLDEPTSNVDAASALLIKEASLRAREQWGTTLITASHDWAWLHEVCDEIIHLFKGRVIGSGMGNIILGPWQKRSDGCSERNLPGGKRIVVSEAPHKESLAILDSAAVSIFPKSSTKSPENLALSGVILALALQKSSGGILVTAAADSLHFHSHLTKLEVLERRLHPGQEVWVSFDPKSIRWV